MQLQPQLPFQLSRLLLLLSLLALVKAGLLLIDGTPGLFMGDSGSYLNTALYGTIPEERSFTYGFVLRGMAVWPHSLRAMVYAQSALSACSSWLVAVCLIRYFKSSFTVAAICSLLCALEPLQLLSERYVLTEAVATFVFALFVWTCFEYLKLAKLSWLVVAQIIGVLLISIRISFLPIVLFASLALPLMKVETVIWLKSVWRVAKAERGSEWKKAARLVALPMLVSLGMSQLCLLGYRHFYAYVIGPPMHGHPAYLYRDGLFLLSDFSPLVTTEDYPIAAERNAVFGAVRFSLRDPKARDQQRWAPGGICSAITKQCGGDEYKADALARKTALRAIKHHPLSLLELGMTTFAEYFEVPYFRQTLVIDNGIDRRLDAHLAADYKHDFGEDFDATPSLSFTKWWQERSVLWYWFLLILPLLFLAHLAFYWRKAGPCHWLCEAFLISFLEGSTVTVTRPTARFLTTMAWLAFIVIGASANDALGFSRKKYTSA